jgi:catechol 2,3-dioxygenase-like lactoylglutathione lyase family enzyme
MERRSAVAIVPCSDLDASEAFYGKLGFRAVAVYEGYRILHDDGGAGVHLTRVPPGSVDPASNAFGIYLYSPDVESLAAGFGCAAEAKPWGLREFAVLDPEGTLVRVGWP